MVPHSTRSAARRANDTDGLRCGLCARPVPDSRAQYAVLADSSIIHPQDPALDGRRVVIACSRDHIAALQAAAPTWCDEQLWAGRLARARSHHRGAPLPLETLARRAELSVQQARQGLAWQRARATVARVPDG